MEIAGISFEAESSAFGFVFLIQKVLICGKVGALEVSFGSFNEFEKWVFTLENEDEFAVKAGMVGSENLELKMGFY